MIKSFKKLNFQSTKKGFIELKERFIFLVTSIIIFRIGSFIPIPGINISILHSLIVKQHGTIIDMFNMFSGGALSRASIFALGVMPYISSSIIMQLLTVVHPYFITLKKEGEEGKKKINKYTKYTTLVLAFIQAIGITTALPKLPGMNNLVINPNIYFFIISNLSLITGTIFLMWLGRQITKRGIGNGVSIIIVIGIITTLPLNIGQIIEQIKQGNLKFFMVFVLLFLVFLIILFIVFIEKGQRKINVQYARRYFGKQMYNIQQSTHLPLKINMAGVIPAIFSSSIILFISTIFSWFSNITNYSLLKKIAIFLQPRQPLYICLYILAIIFFCFFYTILVFNPQETADNLKKSGAYISGIRPGEQTAKYIKKIIMRLTFTGSLYITFICLVPEFLKNIINVPFYLSGTSLLIVIVVIIDFITQIQTLIMSTQYESILKKINLKG
ncbi:preprotein translocase subunit SecY [Enterobacteriaceae endosymbiont of Donacia bicoloricornis]|uniref:preprotein translocase subunit SecY n=1 Tax=Enterobacteriaceae endosymbiont of Donacia bicoloricornis TaxID=2675772 RepID=UPI00144A1F81|nr:preprotein translocase subunit SecY [Enterobacteriaceae endosymbiont of Donacia bicoloricornis]QJC37776.1 preprotein translocase subunit SecY [Enterobacteriaceae endosymbiont of Donacia bicoloricornis]